MDYEKIDPEIVEICKLLNNLDSVERTLFSCAGYGDRPQGLPSHDTHDPVWTIDVGSHFTERPINRSYNGYVYLAFKPDSDKKAVDRAFDMSGFCVELPGKECYGPAHHGLPEKCQLVCYRIVKQTRSDFVNAWKKLEVNLKRLT